MENEWGFSLSDNFEEARKKVKNALTDPKFREELNRSLIILSTSDGSRYYSAYDIDLIKGYEAEITETERMLEPGSFREELSNKLKIETENLEKFGVVKMSGYGVFELVDEVLLTVFPYRSNVDNLAEDIEIAIAGIISCSFARPYDSYQLDISVSGQGLMDDTYSMVLVYKPIPKNLDSSAYSFGFFI